MPVIFAPILIAAYLFASTNLQARETPTGASASPSARSASSNHSGMKMKSQRVLLVATESSRFEAMADRLQKADFEVYLVHIAEAALALAREGIGIAVIDSDQSTTSASDLIRALRAEHGDALPIIFIADAGTSTRLNALTAALKAGADFTFHPAQTQELEAKIANLLRGDDPSESVYGPIHLDRRARSAVYEGKLLDLTAYEYATLEFLMSHAGRWVSATSLVEHLYSREHDRTPDVAANVIPEYVAGIQRKMDPNGSRQPIETSNGGYRISPKLEAGSTVK